MAASDDSPVPWKVLSSEKLIEDEWITVRSDSCQTSAGVVIEPYYVLEYPDWVTIAAFNENSELLVIEQYRHGLGEACFELPGGRIELSDSSSVETIERELQEETGCVCESIELLGKLSPNPATHNNFDHFYIGYNCQKVSAQNLDDAEQIRSFFVSREEVIRMIEAGEFLQSRHIGLVFMALRKFEGSQGVARNL
jgi:8-oxo-dGTP pyrophosphatase MutT (NUDIX family)